MCNVAVILRVTFIFKNRLRSRMRGKRCVIVSNQFLKSHAVYNVFQCENVEVSRI